MIHRLLSYIPKDINGFIYSASLAFDREAFHNNLSETRRLPKFLIRIASVDSLEPYLAMGIVVAVCVAFSLPESN